MINVSSAFKNAIANDERNYIINATITLQDTTVLTITNANLMLSGNYVEDGLCADSAFSALGATPIGSITLVLNNVDEAYSQYDFQKAEVALKVGLKYTVGTTETTEWLTDNASNTRGIYYVDKATYTATSVSLYCLDNMYRLDYKYDSNLVYPASLDTIVRDICTEFNLTLATPNFPQKSFTVSTAPGADVTYREVLGWCAEIAGCWVRCDMSGGLAFGWYDQDALEDYYDDEDESGLIPITAVSQQNIGLDDIVITGVVLNREEETTQTVTQTLPDGTVITYDQTVPITHTYTYGTTDYAIELNGKNGFITASNAQNIVDRLGAMLTGLAYRQANISHTSIPYMQAGDLALLTDRKGRKHVMLVTRTVFTVGSYQQTVSAGKTTTQNSSQQYTALTKQYAETRQEVYKETQERQEAVAALAAKMSDNDTGLYSTAVETPPGSGSYVYYYHNKPDLADSDIQLVISAVGVTVTANGTDPNPAWYGLTVDGQLISSILNTTGVNADWINTGQLVVHKTVGSTEVEMLFVDCDTGTVRISDQVPAIDDARKVATNYLTYDANVGLDIGYNGTQAKTRITGNGVEIFDATGVSAAAFSASGVRVGESGKHRVQLSSNKLEFINEDATTIGEMGTAEDATFSTVGEIIFTGHPEDEDAGGTSYGTFDVTLKHKPILSKNKQTTDYIKVTLNLIYLQSGDARVAVNYVNIYEPDTEYEMLAAIYYPDVFWVNFYIQYVSADDVIRIRTNPQDGKVYSLNDTIDFEFVADYSYLASAPYYTFGTRQVNGNKGAYSLVAGYNNEASGFTAFVEGENNEATGNRSHAEGYGNLASGANSHAEGESTQATGEGSHAEGIGTLASGTLGNQANHAEGINTQALGNASHAGGIGTIASGAAETAIGKYNDLSVSSLFAVGDGSDDNNRSNAMFVGTDGKVSANKGIAIKYPSGSGQTSPPYFVCLKDQDSEGAWNFGFVTRANMPAAIGMGTVSVHNGSTVNVTNGADTTLCNSGSLSAGTYILKACVQFAASASGRRVIFLSKSNTGSFIDRYTRVTQPPAPSSYTEIELTYITTITSATTYYLRAYQNSGSTLSCTGGIEYVKLRG